LTGSGTRGDADEDTLINIENLTGSSFNDTLIGNGGANTIVGGDGNDTINAGGGVDSVDGGSGNDHIEDDDSVNFDVYDGGSGIDTIDYSADKFADGTVTINLATGQTVAAGGITETIRNFESVEGSQGGETIIGSDVANILDGNGGNDRINGGAGNDTLNGDTGDDILDGGTGADVMFGGVGDDMFVVDNAADEVHENIGAGTDIVFASVNYALQAGQEVEILRVDVGVTAGLVLVGNEFDNKIIGGDGNDSVFGGRGDDVVQLGAGNDAFVWNPGDGNDTVEGQDGTDAAFFNGANVNESIDISANGTRVRVTHDAANVDLNGVEGIGFHALGGADNIVIDDLSGTDLTRSGIAIDLSDATGVADGQVDTVTVNGSDAGDRINISLVSDFVSITGSPAMVAILHADATDQLIVNGGGGDDVIDASALAAGHMSLTLNGGVGADTLIGSAGADLVLGGDGNDVASLGAGNDVFVWNPGDGNDTVEGQAGVDALVFNGADINENITISANGSRVDFVRDVGNVTMDLNGVEGVIFGALGGADNITINDVSGTDLALSGVAINLGGAAGGGDGSADTVTIDGRAGNDSIDISTINGMVFTSGSPAAVAIFNAEASNDRLIVDGGAGDDTINASGLGAGAIGLTLNGGAGNDTLTGSAGNDVLIGSAGLDHLFGGAGQDTFVFTGASLAALDTGVGANRDVIQDFAGDIIDLHLIDANLGVGGDQAFSFIGTNAFTAAGQVHFFADGAGNTIVEGNVDNNLGADFQIELHAFAAQLQAGNFVL
jgi:Ca2+-binding RTX toxin-like protein